MKILKQKKEPKNKRTKQWEKSKKILKKIYFEKEITYCEMCPNYNNFGLSFAHKKKRVEYYKEPDKLHDFNETLLLCLEHHQEIEKDKELTEETFKKLRI